MMESRVTFAGQSPSPWLSIEEAVVAWTIRGYLIARVAVRDWEDPANAEDVAGMILDAAREVAS